MSFPNFPASSSGDKEGTGYENLSDAELVEYARDVLKAMKGNGYRGIIWDELLKRFTRSATLPLGGEAAPMGMEEARRLWHRELGAEGSRCPTQSECIAFDDGFRWARSSSTAPASATLATEKGLTPTGQHIADCERDAARYRWLRDHIAPEDVEFYVKTASPDGSLEEISKETDAAIDALLRPESV